jgi:hypothetical protein
MASELTPISFALASRGVATASKIATPVPIVSRCPCMGDIPRDEAVIGRALTLSSPV